MGGITTYDRTLLQIIGGNLTGISYRKVIMQRRVIPFIRKQQNLIVLQQDNAKLYVARVVRDFFAKQNDDAWHSSAVSPDLSLKEHI